MNRTPAVLGGEPDFKTPAAFAKPTLLPYEELEPGFRDIITTGMVTKGHYLKDYEQALCRHLDVPYALGVSNCTMGLFMLMKALGIKGKVIVPSFSFMATFHIVEIAGLTPVFVDCERDTFTIDPEKIEQEITPDTSAIIAVNIFGNPPDIDAIEKIAKKHGLRFIMDSAHSFGTLYHGKPMGSHGDGESFSSSATKLLATGEGGVVTTKHKEIYDFIDQYREYGNDGSYDCQFPGINGRISEFHSWLGLKLLNHLENFAQARNRLAGIYTENLKDIPGISFQKIRENCRSSYKDFTILVDEKEFGINRDLLSEALKAEGVGTRKYFCPPGHLQSAYAKYRDKYEGVLVNTELISSRALSLPFYSHMEDELPEQIARTIAKIHHSAAKIKESLTAAV
ncbi:MAG: DegT/DnrJ/EryC1/StrS family aminotransferase [Firmicutes bacterium]|nr:DegT/DnrJ/EryC1/StrS family aminotransferase [Bacillota bacterium]